MPDRDDVQVLTVNTGSSSLKAGLYAMGAREQLLLSVQITDIGGPESRVRLSGTGDRMVTDERRPIPDHRAALVVLHEALDKQTRTPDAVGHRVVHGGAAYTVPRIITSDLLAALDTLVPLAPDHLPQAIEAVHIMQQMYPSLPHIACFDTAFHSRMPALARRYPLPERLTEAGIVRYGFHGLSYEFIMTTLRAIAPAEAGGRVIVAHLGNGASMAAVRDGIGVETTMGFTPAGGLVMGTRTGDLDPGVVLYLLQHERMTAAAVDKLVNTEAGVLGVSGITADMRELLDHESTDPRAACAVELFCYQARKFLGALAAVLGGFETLIFTGGIGEHAAPVRARICGGLEFLGIRLDPRRNAASAPVISRTDSGVTVRVIATDEDLMIARHTRQVIGP
jgi:acetate kinase